MSRQKAVIQENYEGLRADEDEALIEWLRLLAQPSGCDRKEYERAHAQQQASDLFVLQRAKEILCELWKRGGIDMSLRSQGDCALAGAIEATLNPQAHKLSPADGRRLYEEQWQREQEGANHDF